ncbi:MAG: SH3 domain-containing protein [Caldilineaceae bacterium]
MTVTNGITTAPAPDIQPITGGLTTATITGTVNITAGLNARSEPSTNGVLVALLENNTQLALDGRTADNSWYRSQLSNSVPIWVFADFIVVDGDPTVLPVIDVPGISASETNTVTETATTLLSTSTTVTESAESPAGTLAPTATPAAPAEAPSDTPALASVNTILGAAIRAAPEAGADAIATAVYENVLTVTGRSADNAWLQVDLGNSEVGWVLVSAVELSVDLATLPVAP